MTSLLSSKPILQLESSLLALFDRTFEKSFKLKTANFKKELPNRIRQQFSSQTFAVQFDNLITELIRVSILHADGQMGKMQAAKVNPSYVLTEEAVRISKDLSKDVGDKIVRLLQDDAIYYEGPAKLARRIEDLYEGQRYRAMGFTQTFTADVATNTTVQRYRQYGVRYMEFDAELDDRTTDQCRCLDGVVFDLEKTSIDSYRPPLHHRCRSAILPIPITREPDQDMIFENRDFSRAIDNPDEVFKKIEKFNDKYRISQFTLDEDIAARIMMEKGAFVGIEGPALDGLIKNIGDTLNDIPKKNVVILPEKRAEIENDIVKYESKIKNKKVEYGQAIGPDGKVVFEKKGSSRTINIPYSEVKKMKSAVFTHNHPSGDSFSIADIKTASQYGMNEIRATGVNGTYTMKMKDGSDMTEELFKTKILPSYNKNERIVGTEYNNLVKSIRGGESDTNVEFQYFDRVWRKVSEDVPEIMYTRIEVL